MSDLAQEVEALKAQVKELQHELKQRQLPTDWSSNLFFPIAPFCHGVYEGLTEKDCADLKTNYESMLKEVEKCVKWLQHTKNCQSSRFGNSCEACPVTPDCRLIELRRALLLAPQGAPVLFRFVGSKQYAVIKHMLLVSGWKITYQQQNKVDDNWVSDLFIIPNWCEFPVEMLRRDAFQYERPMSNHPMYMFSN